MRDNELFKTLKKIIKDGLVAHDAGLSDVAVKQSFQPTTQGANSGRTVYLFKISDVRYGFLKRTDKWDHDADTMVHTESQWYESTFQANPLVIIDPATMSDESYTASDLANIVAAIMQSDATRCALHAKNIGILRVQDVRNPYFVDDKDRFEASPSFDFTLTHEQVIISTSPVVERAEYNIKRV